ncbi:NAD(P)H-dependent glycerol-3-phosphate dehydrogenase [Suttonella ornithocola]|uniref:Glycerol-3-phosphate dehydrogenase [NAD(P)+] n=1 Tax=Suttonella ornithocola TaxID=279832 RepID=A0A380MR74_9GAMM|nr:NAD(P)H-dependent glycerol-3-phosphate dehydrogenase [Suttonella ornithocola]SUO94556.1 Glycerol-3-phosphate dehydrogenase [NAD(P)+] [Suttonella ornithocola]
MNIAVLGAGSWGTALALQLARGGHTVRLWGHRPEHIAQLTQNHENARYLPGVFFPDTLYPTDNLPTALTNAELLLMVVPSEHFSPLLTQIAPYIQKTPVLWAIKGFEHGTGRLLSSVFTEHFGQQHPHAILAGPSFAKEVAAGQPTAVTIAAATGHQPEPFARPFHRTNFLCYTSNDIIGAQIGGAVKNIIAIATGIADGLGCGANTRAALITRGLHETTRLAEALGASPQTLAGLAGMGDLVLTATDNQSRNRRFGLALGQGKTAEQAKAEIGQVVEGEGAAHDTWVLACRHNIRMPIVEHIHHLLSGKISLAQAVTNLTTRKLKQETP